MSGKETRVLFLRTDPANLDPRVLKETSSLTRAGYAVTVFGWDRSGLQPREETIGGTRFRRSRIPAPYGSKLLIFILPFYWIHAVSVIRSCRPAVVHACDFDALVPALIGKLLFGHAVVYDIFDHFADKLSGVPRFVRTVIRSFDARLMRRADLILVTDDHRRNHIGKPGGVPVGVIMNVPPLHEASDERPARTGTVRICYAGVIHEHRGLRLIASAIDGLEGIETIFAGWIPRKIDEDFLQRQAKISYIGKLAYADALKFVGECDIVLALYDPSVPINRMASSNKVFEAMSVGIPVISNRETTMAEIIETVSCGIAVPYGDQPALSAAIAHLRDHPDLRHSMGANGRRSHRERFNWAIMEKRLLDLYAALPSTRHSGGG